MTTTTPAGEVPSISFRHMTKRYGSVTALEDFSADVVPGRITAFLGANGSGKTTSMRVLLGLADPSAGTALFTAAATPSWSTRCARSAPSSTRVSTRTAARATICGSRLRRHASRNSGSTSFSKLVGLCDAARRRVGGFSLGMRQRLALASALIGDPSVLVMDEPFNGLDPAGIQILRGFLRHFADNGGTVFLSSHLLAEVAQQRRRRDHHRPRAPGQRWPDRGVGSSSNSVQVASLDPDLLATTLCGRGGVGRAHWN